MMRALLRLRVVIRKILLLPIPKKILMM